MSDQATTITPHLCIKDAAEAIEFYKRAFGAELIGVYKVPDGKVMHAAMSIGGAQFYIVDEFPEHGALGPLSLGGSPVTMHLHVPDCEAVFARAVEAGCEVKMPLQDMFWGDRYGFVIDPHGHKWSIATTVRQVSPEELQAAVTAMAG